MARNIELEFGGLLVRNVTVSDGSATVLKAEQSYRVIYPRLGPGEEFKVRIEYLEGTPEYHLTLGPGFSVLRSDEGDIRYTNAHPEKIVFPEPTPSTGLIGDR